MNNPLVEQFGNEKRWVNYRLIKVKGRMTKIPYATNGKKASSIDPNTWSIYKNAKAKSENVGIVFTADQLLLGIDIDHCIVDGKIEHEQKEEIASLILEAETYTEISPSGSGLHLYLSLTEPLKLQGNKKAPFELYTIGRYFTFTGNCYGEPREVRKVTPEEVLTILGTISYPWTETVQSPTKTPILEHRIDLPDDVVLSKTFNSKNGDKIKALYDGDASEYKNDISSAEMALLAHLAFWTGRNAEQMERLWISAPLAQREKTLKRKDYRDRSIKNAIANCKEIYESGAMKLERENFGIDLLFTYSARKDKIFTQNTENICRVLRFHENFVGNLRYDTFKNVLELKIIKDEKNTWRAFEDNDVVNIQTNISVLFPCFGKVGKEMVFDAVIKVAKENAIDSASDYIKSIKWDGKARLDTWLVHTYGTPDDVYNRAVGSNWIKGLVKRIIEPGCKFDYVLVLEGEQGSKKSTSLYVLGGMDERGSSWHVETTMSTDSKDFFMQFAGKAIIEFSEGETLSRTEVKKLKAIITMQFDKYRPPYERSSQDFPRRCVFAMTTNQTEYLKDETGNRRWLPVTVVLPEANVEWLRENRDQIFAEAYHRLYVGKESIYEFPKEETLKAQNDRRIHDENGDLIYEWYYGKLTSAEKINGVTVHQVYRDALNGGFNSGKLMDKYHEMKIADVLKNYLKLTKKRASVGGMQTYRWFDENNVLKLPETKEEMLDEILDKMNN